MNCLISEKSGVVSLSEAAKAVSTSDRSKHQVARLIFSASDPKEVALHMDVPASTLMIYGESVVGKSSIVSRLMGLSEVLAGRGGISAYSCDPNSITATIPKRPTLYRKNGMLVGHIGRKITPEDVARTLAEE
jgi:ABC-type transport system involved in cytochrome bd biosynthesis fused ATPase/permease subunit